MQIAIYDLDADRYTNGTIGRDGNGPAILETSVSMRP